jgi:hypothetical protein
MTTLAHTSIARGLPRTLIAAALAVTGTIASFGVTAGPAHAQGPTKGYVATLSAKLDAPKRTVVNGVVWNCAGDTCVGPVDGSRATTSCAKVVREFGQVAAFATPKGELSAEDLARCNGN